MENALALINSQEQKIKELTEEVADLKAIAEQYQKPFEEAKADTMREIQERVKAVAYLSCDWSHGEHPMVVELDDIDQIATEMVEGERKK